jgi:spermidine synthase
MTTTNVEFLAAEETPIGTIALRRRELLSQPGTVVTEITLDHEFLMSSYNTMSERALAHSAIEMHGGSDLDVLVGGLGLGYTAHSALASRHVSRVEVVEFLSPVIEWVAEGLVPLSTELEADPRLVVRQGDVYAGLAESPKRRFDVIIIDVDHSPDERLGEANGSFYTDAGLQLAKRHLEIGGVLGVWSYAEHTPFADALRRVFSEVRVELVRFYNHIVEEDESNWLFFARG